MQYHVHMIPQQTGMGCWAASIAMVFGWAQRVSIDPATIAARSGYQTYLTTGLPPSDNKVLNDWGIETEAPQSYAVAGFHHLLQQYGPLWVAADVAPGPSVAAHVRVVTGFDANPDPAKAIVYINDPWEKGMRTFRLPNAGAIYTLTYQAFVQEIEDLARSELKTEAAPVYVAHLPSRPHSD